MKSMKALVIGAAMTISVFAASITAMAATQFVQNDMNFRNGASITGAPIFEINTGAMSRGYRKAPYPASDILRAICMRGGRIMINSDSHEKTTQDAFFYLSADLAKEAGFTEQTVLTDEGFISIPL